MNNCWWNFEAISKCTYIVYMYNLTDLMIVESHDNDNKVLRIAWLIYPFIKSRTNITVEQMSKELNHSCENGKMMDISCSTVSFLFSRVLVIAPSVELSIRQIEDDNTEVVISLQAVVCNFCRVSCDSTCNTSNGLVGCSAAFMPYSIIASLTWQFLKSFHVKLKQLFFKFNIPQQNIRECSCLWIRISIVQWRTYLSILPTIKNYRYLKSL